MDKPYIEADERSTQQKMRNVVAYSAHVQEAMRYDRLSSSDYLLVMAILHAVSQGETEDKWKEEHQQKRKNVRHPSQEKETSSVSADDDYEQLVHRLKALMLWPW